MLDSLAQAAEAITACLTIPAACQTLAHHATRLTQADRAIVHLVDHQHRAVTLTIGAGHVTERDLPMTYPELYAGLSGQVFGSGEARLSLSAADEPEATRQRRLENGTGALIIAPLTLREEIIGTITTVNQLGQRAFTPDDVATLTTLVTLAATTIQNIRLFDDMQAVNRDLAHRALQLETSHQVGQQITSLLDPKELLAQVVLAIQNQFNYYYVSVWLVTDQQDSVVLHAGAGRVAEDLRDLLIPMNSANMIVTVCKTGQAVRLDDVAHLADYAPLAPLTQTRSELALPLRIGERVLGALDILSDQPAAFTADDQATLQSLANQIAIAIRNAQLYTAERERRHLAEMLEQAGRELIADLNLREMPGRILERLAGVVPYAHAQLLLRRGDDLSVIARRGFADEARAGDVSLTAHDTYRQLVETARPRRIADVTQVRSLEHDSGASEDLAWLGIPLVAKDRVIGLVTLTRPPVGAFSAQEAALAMTFAGQAALALENARQYDDTTRFNEMLERMVEARVEELHQAIEILERLDKSKSKFIEVAAHELRTPLTLVKGYGSMLSHSPAVAKDAELEPLMQGILSGVTRLHDIINSMLDVAKIDSQALNMRRSPVKLSKLIEPIGYEFRAALAERQLTLTLSGLDVVPLMVADSALLHKAFWHLIVNAIKYTPDGGTITVSGQVITRSGDEPVVEVVVSDTGIGIEAEHQKFIFEKFYQTGEVSLHSSGKTKFKGGGSGLGLSIVKGVVQAHGGKIWVESPGYDEQACPGSAFHVLLPLALAV